MIRSLSRYYHTLKHLKPIQIRYQLWYRLRDRFFPVKLSDDVKVPKFQTIQFSPFPSQFEHYLGDKRFSLLNQEHQFKKSIDWNYPGHGKLWTYQLNYFDYLHQPGMTWETGKKLMDDFLNQISSSKDGLEPYPVSLRMINWIKFLAVHNRFPQEIVDSVYSQYQVLSKKLEYHLLGNHLLENGFSLLFGAVFFQNTRLSRLAETILKSELEEQILGDGAHFELSPMYHCILLQRALDGYNLLVNNDHDFQELSNLLQEKIQKMVNWLETIMLGNGETPMFNDSTCGQALHPEILLTYAEQLGFIPEPGKLNESGYRKFEFGDVEMVADVGSVGPSYQPGHAHCDLLSFVLHHRGKPVIVDRGISTYEKSRRREEERGTASHNTVRINGLEQSDLWGGFRAGRRAIPEIIVDEDKVLSATHSGYDPVGCKHRRNWTIQDACLHIEDRVEGGVVKAEAFFHFHPEVAVQEIEKGKFLAENLIIKIGLFWSAEIETYEYCLGFNKTTEALRIRVTFGTRLETEIS